MIQRSPSTAAGTAASPHRAAPARRRRDERGAIIVEFALVATIISVLVIAVFEIGMAWSDNQSVTHASRAGARVVSQFGTDATADNQALRAVEAGLGGLNGDIERIVIFEADITGGMPAACETATVGYSGSANCNVYDAQSLANIDTVSFWGTGSSCGTADGNWCSVSERNDSQATATYVGVQVEFGRTWLAGFFGNRDHTITETTVMRIEPN